MLNNMTGRLSVLNLLRLAALSCFFTTPVFAQLSVTVQSTADRVLTIAEGATATYQVSIDSGGATGTVNFLPMSGNTNAVTVTPASLMFNVPTNVAQMVTVRAIEDADGNHEMVSLGFRTEGSNTNFNSSSTANQNITAVVIDDEAQPGVVFSSSTPTVNEGATGNYTVRLNSPPTEDVNIAVTSTNTGAARVTPASLMFTSVNWFTVQTVMVTGIHDGDANDATVRLNHTVTTTDTTYRGFAPDPVTVTVTDDEVVGVTLVPSSLTVDEGSNSTYMLALGSQPSHAVTVMVVSDDSNIATASPTSLTFGRNNWNRAQTVTVNGAQDPDARDQTVRLRHMTASTDGDYSGKTFSPVNVTVMDRETVGVTVTPATVAVGESNTGGYRIVLDTLPSADVTVAVTSGDPEAVSATPSLTFTEDNWNTVQTVMVTGVEDADSDHESVRLSHTVTSMDSSYNRVAVTVTNAGRDDNSGTVTVTVTDNEVAGATVSATLLTVAEGSTGMYTLELNTRPSAAVTVMVTSDAQDAVTVTSSLTFTTTNWNVARTVTVTGVEDTDASNERVRLSHTVSSMDNDYNDVSIFPVVVNTTDNDTAGVRLSTTALTVAEGGNNTFTVVLNSLPTDIVSMVISNPDDGAVSISPSDFVFSGADWDQPRTVTVMAVEDADARDESVSLTLNSASTDLNYDGVARSVAVTVTDDEVPSPGVTVSLTTLAVAEGGTGDYTVVLDAPPSAAVNITVRSDDISAATATSPLMFTSDNWSMPQTVTVMGVEDVDAVSESGVRLSHRVSSTDARYGTLTPDDVMVNLTDNDMAGLDVVTELNVKEGEMGTLTLRLHSRPTHPVVVLIESADTAIATVTPSPSLTFNETNWNIARTLTVTGIGDADASDETVALRLGTVSADPGYLALAVSITVTVTDDEMVSVNVSTDTLAVSEGGTGTYMLVLGSQPSTAVMITVASNNEAATVSATPLMFTRDRWNIPQIVTVSGAEDANSTNERASLTHTVSSSDIAYNAVMPAAVSVNVSDNDTPGVSVSPTRLEVAEGANVEYMLMLNTQPAHAVMITVGSGDMGAVSVSPTTLTFSTSDWNTGKTFTVTGEEDADANNEVDVQLTHTASSTDNTYNGNAVAIADVSVTVDDNETAGVTVSETSLTFNEGTNNNTYTLVLDTRPTAAMTITVMTDDAEAASVSPAMLTFDMDDWNTAKTVTVMGVADADANDETVSLTHTFNGGGPAYAGTPAVTINAVTVTVEDIQTAGVTVMPSTLRVPEGGSGTYMLALTSRPVAVVTVDLLIPNSGVVNTSPTSLTFTTSDWRTARTVTVRGVQDPDANDASIIVSHRAVSADPAYNANALTIGTVDVTVTDDDIAGMTVVPGRLTVGEGDTGSYTLALATRPRNDVTIMVTSDNTAAATVSSTPLMFTTSNWSQARTVRVVAVEDANGINETVLLTHMATSMDSTYNGSAVTTTLPVTVADNDVAGVTVAPTNPTIDEGGTGSYMVVLNTRPTDEVRVTVSNGNTAGATASPATLTFTTDNWNRGQTVTLTGVEDGDTNNASVRLSHTSASADSAYNAGAVTIAAVDVTVRDDDTAGVAVSQTALTILEGGSGNYMLALTSQPDAAVMIAVSSANTAAVTVTATLTFTEDNWNTAQTVTVMGVEDADANDASGVQLSHVVTSTGTAYAAVTAAAVSVTVNDDDTAGLTLTPGRVTVGEGGSGTYMLVLTSRPSAAVTVAVSSPDTDAVTVTATLTFTEDNWNSAQTVTVMGVRDADTDDERVQLSHAVTSMDTAYRAVTAALVVTVTETAAVSLDVDGSGGNPNQSDGLMLGRYLFGIRDEAGLLDTIPGSPSFNAVTTNIAGAFASGRLDVDGSGGDPNQSDGLMLGRYLFGIRDTVGLLDTIPGNPSFNEVRTNIEALLR